MELSQNTSNVSVDLETFLDHHEDTLPSTVKIVDGFCGTNDDDSLDADQICVFYKVERQMIIMALDEFRQEICVQQNSNTKVHLLPLTCNTYYTVLQLFNAQTRFILVLEDILSAGILKGSKLKLSSDRRSVPNHLKCQVVNRGNYRDVLLPLHLTGTFLPLLDISEFYLDEVLAQNQLPVKVRFVSESSQANDRFTAQSLTNLGNIRLTYKTEVAMVFAASFDNELSLYQFPKSLDVSVACGFKVRPETSKKIKECRKALQISESDLKRIENVFTDTFYFTATPVRRFNFQSLQKTPLPSPRSKGNKKSTLPEEKLHVNKEESKKHDHVWQTSKPNPDENCQMSGNYTDSKRLEEMNPCSAFSEITNEVIYTNEITGGPKVPALPSKTKSRENEAKDTKLESRSRPVPKPRTRLKATAGCREIQMVRTQWQGENVVENIDSAPRPETSSTEDDGEEINPELPPRPLFLQPLLIGNEEEETPTPQEDNPPPLPPKNGEKTCPEQQHNENDFYLEPVTPPPALPPRKESFGEDHMGLAYKVVDLTDWRKFEEYGAYTEVKDDRHVFKQNESRNLDTEDYLFMKENKPEVKTSCEEMMQSLRPAGKETKEAQQAEEESSDDDAPYEEIDDSYGSSKKESRLEMNTNNQKKAEVKTPTVTSSSTTSSSHSAKHPAQTSREIAAIASRPVNKKDIWISGRREDDCMDFKDIEQFFKLRKQLNSARAQVEDLKKHVAVKHDPTKTTGMVPDTSDRMTPFCSSSNDGDSRHLDNKSTDENRNVLVSPKTFCENGNGNFENGEECELGSNKVMTKEIANSTSLMAKSIVPKMAGPTVQERRMSNSDISGSDDSDDDVYVEYHHRKYVNQEITAENNSTYYVNVDKEEHHSNDFDEDGNEPIYYNTVEMEAMTDDTLGYLQLGNASDEDENVYVNVDAQGSNRDNAKELFEIKELANNPSTSAVSRDDKAVFRDSEPPPLPPKQRSASSSLHDN